MTDISLVADALTNLGFTDYPEHPAGHQLRVAALSANGPYAVLGSWRKDNVVIHVEQNTAPETITDPDGNVFTAAQFTFPPVIVIETVQDDGSSFDPARTLAVSYGDIEALYALAGPQSAEA